MIAQLQNKKNNTKLKHIDDIPIGTLCQTLDNKLWLRAYYSMICLSDLGKSFESSCDNNPGPTGALYEVLPLNTVITLTQKGK